MSTSTDVNRGRGGRGRGGSRGQKSSGRGGANAPPLASQMKQLQRLDEPGEMALFRRYKALGPVQVVSTYGPAGLLDQKVCVPSTQFRPVWGINPAKAAVTNLTLLQCESILVSITRAEESARLLARRSTRLASHFHSVDLDDLPADQLDKLRLSNAEFSRQFPTEAGNGGAAV